MSPEKKPNRYGEKGNKNMVATAQQDLGSDSDDEELITEAGTKGTLSLHVNSESHGSNISTDEPLPNEWNRIELFHIRVIINHTKVETLFYSVSSKFNLRIIG